MLFRLRLAVSADGRVCEEEQTRDVAEVRDLLGRRIPTNRDAGGIRGRVVGGVSDRRRVRHGGIVDAAEVETAVDAEDAVLVNRVVVERHEIYRLRDGDSEVGVVGDHVQREIGVRSTDEHAARAIEGDRVSGDGSPVRRSDVDAARLFAEDYGAGDLKDAVAERGNSAINAAASTSD